MIFTAESNKFVNGCVASTGFFDGVHRGHMAVLNALSDSGQRLGLPTCVVTFWPHPRIVLDKDPEGLRLLSSLSEKEERVKLAGIDHFVVIPFSLDFSRLSASDFIEDILMGELNVRHLIVGYDHHIGKGGNTNHAQIQHICSTLGITAERVEPDLWSGIAVSSSKIRTALQDRNLAKANDLLGYTYQLEGSVVHGQKFGRQLGFPTANISPTEPLKLIPPTGVYAVHARLRDTMYKGMLYIGNRPTVNTTPQTVVEVNLFDFNGSDLYGETVTVYFEHYLRGDIKFEKIEDLKKQITKDQINAQLALG